MKITGKRHYQFYQIIMAMFIACLHPAASAKQPAHNIQVSYTEGQPNSLMIKVDRAVATHFDKEEYIKLHAKLSHHYKKAATPHAKAKVVYRYLLEMSQVSPLSTSYFTIEQSYTDKPQLFLRTSYYQLKGGTHFNLIPVDDLAAVAPILYQMLTGQLAVMEVEEKQAVKKPLMAMSHYWDDNNGRNWEDELDSLRPQKWPQSEDWFTEWDSWVRAELSSMCGANGEHCGWDTYATDTDQDGEKRHDLRLLSWIQWRQ